MELCTAILFSTLVLALKKKSKSWNFLTKCLIIQQSKYSWNIPIKLVVKTLKTHFSCKRSRIVLLTEFGLFRTGVSGFFSTACHFDMEIFVKNIVKFIVAGWGLWEFFNTFSIWSEQQQCLRFCSKCSSFHGIAWKFAITIKAQGRGTDAATGDLNTFLNTRLNRWSLFSHLVSVHTSRKQTFLQC